MERLISDDPKFDIPVEERHKGKGSQEMKNQSKGKNMRYHEAKKGVAGKGSAAAADAKRSEL